MNKTLLLIENRSSDAHHDFEHLTAMFRPDAWIHAGVQHDRFKPRSVHGWENCPGLDEWGDLFDFLNAAFERFDLILRLRSPDHPLHPDFAADVAARFPVQNFDHVLSTADECGMAGFFLERLNRDAFRRIAAGPAPITPIGYLNGAGRPGFGRHWLSLDMRRFYYQDHFETMFDSPRAAAINVFGKCNYTCLKCQYHSSALPAAREYPGEMDLDKFAVILEKFKDFKRLTSVYPSITGEPLMHPRILDVVKMIKRAGYACAFTSNASLLTPEMGERLLDAGLDGIAFSVDTLDPAKYDRLQHGGVLAEVERNILAFRDAGIRKRGSYSGTVNFVIGPENQDEREAFLQHWRNHGLNVQFSTYYDIFDHNRPFVDNAEWGPDQRMPCWALWTGLYLTHEGRLVSCGSMAKTLGVKDSIFEMSAPELWRCDAMRSLRAQQLTGAKPGYCKEFKCWTGMLNTYLDDGDGMQCMNRGGVNHLAG